MKKEVKVSREDGALVAYLSGEIDHHRARGIRCEIDSAFFEDMPRSLVLDFSAVRFMDSSGIALILGRVETANAVGARVHLDGLSPSLFKLVRLSGIERIKNLTVTPVT